MVLKIVSLAVLRGKSSDLADPLEGLGAPRSPGTLETAAVTKGRTGCCGAPANKDWAQGRGRRARNGGQTGVLVLKGQGGGQCLPHPPSVRPSVGSCSANEDISLVALDGNVRWGVSNNPGIRAGLSRVGKVLFVARTVYMYSLSSLSKVLHSALLSEML